MSFQRINNLRPSSMIHELHYDEEERVLRTKFTSGKIYDYSGVPVEVVEAIIGADSLGSAFTSIIKHGDYQWREVGAP